MRLPLYKKYHQSFFSIGAPGGSDYSDDGKKLSNKKSKNKKTKKVKERDRSRSMEPISPPVKKRKSDKNEKQSPGSLSPVSEEDNYAVMHSKSKKVRLFEEFL